MEAEVRDEMNSRSGARGKTRRRRRGCKRKPRKSEETKGSRNLTTFPRDSEIDADPLKVPLSLQNCPAIPNGVSVVGFSSVLYNFTYMIKCSATESFSSLTLSTTAVLDVAISSPALKSSWRSCDRIMSQCGSTALSLFRQYARVPA